MNISQIRDVYDRHAPTYDQTLGLVEKLVVRDLRRAFGAELEGNVLEVAIGSGLNLPYYSNRVTSAIGVDLSAGMLAKAAERAQNLSLAVALAQMDAQRLAFPDHAFDTVAVSLALCTVPDPVKALSEIGRVGKPDGRVVFLEHVRSPYRPVYLFERLWSPIQEKSFGCSWVRETVATIQQQGYEIVSERQRLLGIFRLVVARPPRIG